MSEPRRLPQFDPQGRRLSVASIASFGVSLQVNLSSPFVLFVASNAAGLSPNVIGELADSLVKQGAAYAVCWGPNCQLVEDVFDWAWIGYEQFYHFPQDTVLMTTSHPNDSLEQALGFALHAATPTPYFAHSCKDLLALSVGDLVTIQSLEHAIERVLAGAA